MSAVIERTIAVGHPLADIAEKVYAGQRISREDAIRLYQSEDLSAIGALGEYARRKKAGVGREKYVYYIHNMHLNPTNFCVETCRFCSYANPTERNKAYTWTVDRVIEEATKGSNLGINEVHMVGGLNPACNLAYYEDILTTMRAKLPHIHMKAFTAVEIEYLANLEGLTYEEVLTRLVDAGLGSMPGGGAEIFDEEVRERMAVSKTPAPVWLEIHGIAHKMGLKTNATMLTGISESQANKVDHMLLLREQQDKTGGFQCFIPLKCYYEYTNIQSEVTEPSPAELLKDVAISRILLDNFPHIKAYWIQLGVELAQLALSFGADDMDGTIGEEKITHAAGAKSPLQLAQDKMEQLIAGSGYKPVERDTIYNIKQVSELEPAEMSQSLSERLALLPQ